jgi:hypothetical protein
MKPPFTPHPWAACALLGVLAGAARADVPGPLAATVTVDWDKTLLVSKSTPTLQVVVNPMVRRGSPIHDGTFAALKALHANYVRYVPWFPYPNLVVAELQEPTSSHVSWNFSLIDPMTEDFMEATAGTPTVMNFSTVPQWMFTTPKPVPVPPEANALDWDYTQGSELRDASLKELGDYYARLVGWYVNGGFTDEKGRKVTSEFHYEFPIWEVMNEVDFEHNSTPKQYTERYDAIVGAIHAVSPKTQFMGLALGAPAENTEFFEYFLNPANHKPGIPLDYISYHFYASPAKGENPDTWQYTFFDQADGFLAEARYIEMIRKRLSPATKTDTDEIGVILPGDPGSLTGPPPVIPDRYWNAAGALFAYLYANLAKQGIDIVGESQLVGYPSQFPSVTMIDWKNGKPNARYWVLKLLVNHFHPGDRLVETKVKEGGDVAAQAFVTADGHTLLLVNKRNSSVDVTLPAGADGARVEAVDEATGEGAPRASSATGPVLRLAPFGVATVAWR